MCQKFLHKPHRWPPLCSCSARHKVRFFVLGKLPAEEEEEKSNLQLLSCCRLWLTKQAQKEQNCVRLVLTMLKSVRNGNELSFKTFEKCKHQRGIIRSKCSEQKKKNGNRFMVDSQELISGLWLLRSYRVCVSRNTERLNVLFLPRNSPCQF